MPLRPARRKKQTKQRRGQWRQFLPIVSVASVAALLIGGVAWLAQEYWPQIASQADMSKQQSPHPQSGRILVAVAKNDGMQNAAPQVDTTPKMSSDYSSPEAVYAANIRAIGASDHKAHLDCLTQESQTTALEKQVWVAQMRAKNTSQRAALDELLQRHGATGDLATVKDKSGLFRDARLFCDSIRGQIPGEKELLARVSQGRIENVQIEGDTATGVSVIGSGGNEERSQIRFVRVDGQWKISVN